MVTQNFKKLIKFSNFYENLYQKLFVIAEYEFHAKNTKSIKFW